jgi:uncharacterized membrane protein (DUF485 family)
MHPPRGLDVVCRGGMLWPLVSSGSIEAAMTRNARVGLVLFAVYLVLYGGFVGLNAFSPTTMEMTPVAGVNLAILYGFGLIIAALLLALLYGFLCRNEVPEDAHGGATRAGDAESAV